MKLWKLKRTGWTGSCETDGLVIAANDETEARKIAMTDFGLNNVWDNPNLSTCEELIAENMECGIVLRDHHHG